MSQSIQECLHSKRTGSKHNWKTSLNHPPLSQCIITCNLKMVEEDLGENEVEWNVQIEIKLKVLQVRQDRKKKKRTSLIQAETTKKKKSANSLTGPPLHIQCQMWPAGWLPFEGCLNPNYHTCPSAILVWALIFQVQRLYHNLASICFSLSIVSCKSADWHKKMLIRERSLSES